MYNGLPGWPHLSLHQRLLTGQLTSQVLHRLRYDHRRRSFHAAYIIQKESCGGDHLIDYFVFLEDWPWLKLAQNIQKGIPFKATNIVDGGIGAINILTTLTEKSCKTFSQVSSTAGVDRLLLDPPLLPL